MPKIVLETIIDAPITRCFDLARSIDLHMISTSKTQETVIEGRKEGLIDMGEIVTWKAKHFGVWQTHTSKITGYEYPIYFRDDMLKGTFRSFIHEHYFKEKNEKTIVSDICCFESPLGIFGKIFNSLVLTRYMKRFLEERNQIIKQYAESNEWKKIL